MLHQRTSSPDRRRAFATLCVTSLLLVATALPAVAQSLPAADEKAGKEARARSRPAAAPEISVRSTTFLQGIPTGRDHVRGGTRLLLEYEGDYLAGFSGGEVEQDEWRYRGHAQAGFQVDTEDLDWWDGGLLRATVGDLHGEGISAGYVGDLQRLSRIDGDNPLYFGEIYFDQDLGWIAVTFGRLLAESRFGSPRTGDLFATTSFSRNPVMPLPALAAPSFGAVLDLQPTSWLQLSAGYFDPAADSFVDPSGATTQIEAGALILGEATLAFRLREILNSRWRFGLGVDATERRSLATFGYPAMATEQVTDGRSLFASIDEGLRLGERWSVSVFATWGSTDSEAAPVHEHLGGGLVLGLSGDASRHLLGAGVTKITQHEGLTKTLDLDPETIWEFFYRLELAIDDLSLELQPTYWLVGSPGGLHPDAQAGGLRFRIDL